MLHSISQSAPVALYLFSYGLTAIY